MRKNYCLALGQRRTSADINLQQLLTEWRESRNIRKSILMSTLPLTSRSRRTQAQVTEVMRAVPSRATEPEKLFQKALRKAGIRSFKVCAEELPGKPDIVIPGRKLAVFVDGDFWHGNQYRTRGHSSLEQQLHGINNEAYWRRKIGSNIVRDLRNTNALLQAGWSVARFWESDIRTSIDKCVDVIGKSDTGQTDATALLPQKTVAEFFSGIGLVRLALERSGWKTVFANDNDPQKIALYGSNFGTEGLNSRSILDLSADDIPTCALATASFPCNDLSLAGSRKGLAGTHSGTFWAFISLLKAMGGRRPPIVLLENVPGFISSHGGKDLAAAITALNELGYACDLFIVNASNFVPQSRVRLFIIGKQGENEANTDITISQLRPQPLIEFIRREKRLLWNLRPLPDIQSARSSLDQVLEDIPEGHQHWWNQQRAEYFLNQLSERHLKIAKFMIAQDQISYGTAFRRIRNGRSMAELRVDGIAGCLRTPRGGSGRQILFQAGKGKYSVRLLTPRECARLQGVSDEYVIDIADNQALFGFGDAVCVPVVQWIARTYLNPLAAELIRGKLLKPTKK